ncbi:MAG: hypothetical protein CMC35_03500 [Flavobacteriaceae bacterium]|nr:hypothetical protein [Flavobacteriaceae bacterium]|tara:strand:+ start:1820 stop:3349 length:1530 start_codon:yes stop_codon:yes gene_type:complete
MKKALPVILILFTLFNYAQEYEITSFTNINGGSSDFESELENEDWFGHSVEGIGDLDGDGVADIAIGANQDDDGGFNKGAIYIAFLNEDTTIKDVQKISDTEGNFTADLLDWDYFGRSIAYLGDLNDDGLVEIAVSAEYDNEAGHRYGGIYIISLESNGTVASYQKINEIHGNFTGDLDVWDVFGSDIENIGDLNGDGTIDIAVGARRDGDGGDQRGAVWILFLNEDFTVKEHQKISELEGNLNLSLEFQDYFGATITNLGDLNEDGVIDLAVGAYRDDDGGNNKGALYILFMASDGTVLSTQKISEVEGNFNEELLEDVRFGRSTNLTDDINQDGKPDLIVGCQRNHFYILNLNSDGTVDSFEKYGEGLQGFDYDLGEDDYFGHSVSTVGYLNGTLHLAVGAYGDSEFGLQKGAVWLLNLDRTLSSEQNFSRNKNIVVYPNPTDRSFRLSSANTSGDVKIHTMSGNLVKIFNFQINNEYDVSNLSSGTYLVSFITVDGNYNTVQLIVK